VLSSPCVVQLSIQKMNKWREERETLGYIVRLYIVIPLQKFVGLPFHSIHFPQLIAFPHCPGWWRHLWCSLDAIEGAIVAFVARVRKTSGNYCWDCCHRHCPWCYQGETLGEACPTAIHGFPKVSNVVASACSGIRHSKGLGYSFALIAMVSM
jgi:hypothetical protein